MEITEKVSSLYLRLNGFFLMPRFTILGVKARKHVDILAVRLKGSKEIVAGETLITDQDFIAELSGYDNDVKVWAEVGTGRSFDEERATYFRHIFGGADDLRKVFFDFDTNEVDLHLERDILVVPAERCRNLVLARFSQLDSEPLRSKTRDFTKQGSWYWSEEFLGELLLLRKMGFLKESQ